MTYSKTALNSGGTPGAVLSAYHVTESDSRCIDQFMIRMSITILAPGKHVTSIGGKSKEDIVVKF